MASAAIHLDQFKGDIATAPNIRWKSVFNAQPLIERDMGFIDFLRQHQ